MKHASHPFDRPSAHIKIRDVAFDPVIVPFDLRQIGTAPRGEVIDYTDLKTFPHQRFDQV